VIGAIFASCLLASCASDLGSRRPAAAPVTIAHTCTAALQPTVDRFAERVHTNLAAVIDDALVPTEAQLKHLHGRVVVVVGYSSGERQRVGIAHSSGYAALDNHALSLVEKAAPEHASDLPCDAATMRLAIRYVDDREGWPVSNATAAHGTFATPIW
jgi:TonB family protein